MDLLNSCQNLPYQTGFQIPLYILDDLCARFVINLPEEESRDPIRVFFQIELAQWFYLDFYCPENPELKPLNIKDFSTQVFHHCPSLSKHVNHFDVILESWKEYKMAVPTYGAILLDPTLQHCLLVQGYWVKATWGFPKGKVNQDEPPIECAIREVLEETGFDIREMVKADEYLEYKMNEQLSRLYIVAGVPLDTTFQAQTRNEIKSFEWFRIEHLPTHKKDISCRQNTGLNPNAFFMVLPFVKNLRRWISHKQGVLTATTTATTIAAATTTTTAATGVEMSVEAGTSLQQTSRPKSGSVKLKEMDVKQLRPTHDSRTRQHSTGQDSKSIKSDSGTATTTTTTVSGVLMDTKLESVSPRRPSTRKRLQTLKRDVKLDSKQPQTDVTSVEGSGSQQFVCHTWNNFKLDIDDILAAMFPTHSASVS